MTNKFVGDERVREYLQCGENDETLLKFSCKKTVNRLWLNILRKRRKIIDYSIRPVHKRKVVKVDTVLTDVTPSPTPYLKYIPNPFPWKPNPQLLQKLEAEVQESETEYNFLMNLAQLARTSKTPQLQQKMRQPAPTATVYKGKKNQMSQNTIYPVKLLRSRRQIEGKDFIYVKPRSFPPLGTAKVATYSKILLQCDWITASIFEIFIRSLIKSHMRVQQCFLNRECQGFGQFRRWLMHCNTALKKNQVLNKNLFKNLTEVFRLVTLILHAITVIDWKLQDLDESREAPYLASVLTMIAKRISVLSGSAVEMAKRAMDALKHKFVTLAESRRCYEIMQKEHDEMKKNLDQTRLKVVDMMKRALSSGSKNAAEAEFCTLERVLSCASDIEMYVFYYTKRDSRSSEYRNQSRVLYTNLSREGNSQLREQILRGEIELRRVAQMTSEDLCPPALRQEREAERDSYFKNNVVVTKEHINMVNDQNRQLMRKCGSQNE